MNFIKLFLITVMLSGCAGMVYQPYEYVGYTQYNTNSQIGYPQYPIYRQTYQYNIPHHGYYGVIRPHFHRY